MKGSSLRVKKTPSGIHCISIRGIQCECFHQARTFIKFCKMLSNNPHEQMMRNKLHAVCPGYG